MNVLLVSQCNKRALTQTRRILDQFAERRGERTWQTPITREGLATLRKLLKQSARKNTAVACHWIRGRNHSELLWIVGNARRFNIEGTVPTNSTRNDVLKRADEDDWHTAEDIRLLAQMAALLHDLGKASVAFQSRLAGNLTERNRYRHEWVSLRLFQAFVGDDDDAGWLARLAGGRPNLDEWLADDRLLRDGLDNINGDDRYPFRHLPPLAAAIGWLVLTHHRLPQAPAHDENGMQKRLGTPTRKGCQAWLDKPLDQITAASNEIMVDGTTEEVLPYWRMSQGLPVVEKAWIREAGKTARRLQVLLASRPTDEWLNNPYIMHLARLCLMQADHHYSSLGLIENDQPDGRRRACLQPGYPLFANTSFTRHGKRVLDQTLLEHLLGVSKDSAAMAHALPGFERYLPRLANHRGLRKRTRIQRFAWQDKAFDAAVSIRETAHEQGAFIVNMASTGCGKTLANARLLYALADPQQGMRATYALGLRTLTLQTGRSFRQDLHLDDDELAVLTGGAVSRALFEYYEDKAESSGSRSIQSLLEEDSHVLYEGNVADHPLLSRALSDGAVRKLVSAPVLTCTVDHLMSATEAVRGGRQIAPMLRLMSSDLILDELDDYGLEDLPALTRLMYWVGLLGGRVLLSSATLPPPLVEGMFLAYRQGRKAYMRNRGPSGRQENVIPDIPCLWVDEFDRAVTRCPDHETFAGKHKSFVEKRVARLGKSEPIHCADILPIEPGPWKEDSLHQQLAEIIRDGALQLHHTHACADPTTHKQVSFGLVRMANIEPLIQVAKALFAMSAPAGTCIHLCVYHSRFPLIQRSAIEQQLDSAFNRREDNSVYRLPEIRQALDESDQRDHLFVVLASPVCEVGRDWDADWAIAEPSSVRSLIQLAGRVQRHRRQTPDEPNILILDACRKALLNPKSRQARYARPGFEQDEGAFRLHADCMLELLRPEEYQILRATPRIQPQTQNPQPQYRLADLEQARLAAAMLPAQPGQKRRGRSRRKPGIGRDRAAFTWTHSQINLTGVLPQEQRFRDDSDSKEATVAFLPDEDEEGLSLHRIEPDRNKRGRELYVKVDDGECQRPDVQPASGVLPWGEHDLMTLLIELAEARDQSLINCARQTCRVEVPESTNGWNWHPGLGIHKAK